MRGGTGFGANTSHEHRLRAVAPHFGLRGVDIIAP